MRPQTGRKLHDKADFLPHSYIVESGDNTMTVTALTYGTVSSAGDHSRAAGYGQRYAVGIL